MRTAKQRGFTIVELLIVVVIIAILAAITLVTYNGIQQRANNAAIIDAASKSLRMIQSYIAVNDKYPVTGQACITTTTGCMNSTTTFSASSTFDNNIATIGTVPRSIPSSGTNRYGILYYYDTSMTYQGAPAPLHLHYYLDGTNQQCGLPLVQSSAYPNFTASTTGYSSGNDNGKTLCYITVLGPS